MQDLPDIVSVGAEPKTDAQPLADLPVAATQHELAVRAHGLSHVPSRRKRRLVQSLMAQGLTVKAAAEVMDLDDATLRKHYAKEIETGASKGMALMARSIYRRALQGDTTAAIFWLKSKAGWRDRDPLNVQVNNNTLEVKPAQDSKQIEDAVFKALSMLRPSKQIAKDNK